MPNKLQLLRSSAYGIRPAAGSQPYGVPYVNFADRQFGVFDAGLQAIDLIGVPYFSTSANYLTGQQVNNGAQQYIAIANVSAGAWNPAQWSLVASRSYVDSGLSGKVSKLAGGDTMAGNLTISKADPALVLSANPSNTTAAVHFYQGNNVRWTWRMEASASGHLFLDRYNPAGTFAGSPISVDSSTGTVAVPAAPTNALHVTNKQYVDGQIGTRVPLTGNSTINGNLTVTGTLQSNAVLKGGLLAVSTPGANPNWVMQTGGDGVLRLSTNNGSDAAGTSMFEWHVDTQWWISTIASLAYKVGGGPWSDSSDARIKTVTSNYEHGLDQILTLNPVRFTYNGNDTSGPAQGEVPYTNSSHHAVAISQQEFIGLVAQDCEAAMPELVTQRPGYIDNVQVQDLRNIDTGPLIFALINAVKNLAARVQELEAQI